MNSKKVTGCLGLVYFLLLTWVIVFKMNVPLTLTQARLGGGSSVNLVPFAGTAVYNGHLDYGEILLNAVFFLPMGLYLPLLFPKRAAFKQLVTIIGVSAGYEVLQYIFAIGVTDVTDLLSNSLGGLLGLVLYALLSRLLGKKTRSWLNTWALMVTTFILVILYFCRKGWA